MKKSVFVVVVSASLFTVAAAVTAAYGPAATKPAPTADEALEEVVVTGSLIRGVTTSFAAVITTIAAQAEEQGAVDGNELLAQLPQAANMFEALPQPGGGSPAGLAAVSRIPLNAVTLRNLPNVNTGGSALTLSLIDGHQVVPVGTNALGGQGVDAGTIPSSTLLRTEIMPDGGSALYGSDPVAGVFNYIARDQDLCECRLLPP